MNQPMQPEDFPELDDLLEGMPEDRRMNTRELKQWNAGVHQRITDDLDALLEEAVRPKPMWETHAAVVLIHEEHCLHCGAVSQYSKGWFASQKHSTDPHAHRLLAGKPIGKFPLRIERHKLPDVDICAACAEAQIALALVNPSNGAH